MSPRSSPGGRARAVRRGGGRTRGEGAEGAEGAEGRYNNTDTFRRAEGSDRCRYGAVACLFNTVHRSSRTRSIPTASPDEGLEKRHLKEEKEKRSEPRATRCKHPGRGAGDEAGYRRNNTIHARSVPALQCVRRLGANRANCKREKNGNSIKYNNDFFFK